MGSEKLFGFVVGVLLAGSTVAMAGGIPGFGECEAYMPNAGSSPMVLFSLPDGSGNSFDHAQILGNGSEVDASIHMLLQDAFGVPIVGYPAEDMWLQSVDGGLMPCVSGTVADQSTDESGYTIWSNPLRAGGFGSGGCEVIIAAYAIDCDVLPFDLTFNSADINGDGIVNLADVGIFSSHFFDELSYDLSVDFFADGVMNLADVGRLATGVGASCP